MADNSWQVESEPIPGYRLTRQIGIGGFGEVWEAVAPGGLRKAIKFVRGKTFSGSGDSAGRELAGLAIMREVRHPFVLSIERFEVIDGQLVIVMELADRNLEDRWRECRQLALAGIPRSELLACLKEAAEALDVMNAGYGVQHLDIKPGNLFLVHHHVKVADFGLAMALEGFSAEVAAGMTPAYAAPETYDGWASRNSDQYSLAVTYQEMLTGSRPFPGPSARQFMVQHLTNEPNLTPLSDADRHVVAQALAKSPNDRFANCSAFVAALMASSGPEILPLLEPLAENASTLRLESRVESRAISSESVAKGERMDGAAKEESESKSSYEDLVPEEARRQLANFRDMGSLPDVAVELSNLLFGSSDPAVADVLEVLSRRSNVADRVLEMANHPGLKRPWNAKNLPRAVNAMGPKQVCSLVIADSFFGTRQWQSPGFGEPWKTWWRTRSIWNASCAYAWATSLEDACPHQAFTLGLLQDIGIAGMLRAFFKRYRLYLTRTRHKLDQGLHELESKWFGFTHADASSAMLRLWGSPQRLLARVQGHHGAPKNSLAASKSSAEAEHLRRWMQILQGAELWSDLLDGREEERLAGLLDVAKRLKQPASSLLREGFVAARERADNLVSLCQVPAPGDKWFERMNYVLSSSIR
ncbi:MAG: HDOD domain-containing protein [Planctomycetota bacterium]